MYSYYSRHIPYAYIPCRYCYRPYYTPYNNFIGSKFGYIDQYLYNNGTIDDVFQEAIISQTSPDEVLAQEPTPPTPEPTPPPAPEPTPPPAPEPIPVPPEIQIPSPTPYPNAEFVPAVQFYS